MSELRFELRFKTPQLNALELPIIVRKPNMALVYQTLSSQTVEVDPGIYHVSAQLPAGQELSTVIDAREGSPVCVLSPPPEDEPSSASVEFQHYFVRRTKTDTKALAMLDYSRVRGAKAALRKFSGNVLAGNYVLAENWQPEVARSKFIRRIKMEGNGRNQIAQLLQPSMPPLNVVLPTEVETGCEVIVSKLLNGRCALDVRLMHAEADLLLKYIEKGYLRQASIMTGSKAMRAGKLLSWKGGNPIAAAINIYALLRFGGLERLNEWTEDLKDRYEWLSDGLLIRGEHLARLGKHDEALKLFIQLPSRGLPFFSDGLSYAIDRLRLYSRLGEAYFQREELSQVHSVLDQLQPYISYVNFKRPILSYTGINPARPDASALGKNLDEFGGLKLFDTFSTETESIGIDLGNTYSSAAVIEDGEPTIIRSLEGTKKIPSVVAFTKDGGRLVGYLAKRQEFADPDNTISSFKEFMGGEYQEVLEHASQVSYKVRRHERGVHILAGGKEFSPPEVSAIILRTLKEAAEKYLRHNLTRAVISVPLYFKDAQRQATRDAGRIAGFSEVYLINEPTAAVIANRSDKSNDGIITAINFGGSVCDVSVIEVSKGVIRIKVSKGDARLGGDDIDRRVVAFISEKVKQFHGVDLQGNRMALPRLKHLAEKAKIDLSSRMEAEIRLDLVIDTQSGPSPSPIKMTRVEFNHLIDDILEGVINLCRETIRDAGLEPAQIDEVLLVGGSTVIPKFQGMVKELFGRELSKSAHADDVVAAGAALFADTLGREDQEMLLLDVTPLSLGIETLGGVFTKIIERNTTIPTRRSEIFSTASDNQTSVEVHVLQGERPMAEQNRTLGKFHLVGIPPALRGRPQIEVVFEIDTSGIVNVTAKDLSTGREQQYTITDTSALSKTEIDHMRREAEMYAEQDRLFREKVEERNRLESLIYSVEKTLADWRDNLNEFALEAINESLNHARAAIDSNDPSKMNSAYYRLLGELQRLTESTYQSDSISQAHPAASTERASSAEGATRTTEQEKAEEES